MNIKDPEAHRLAEAIARATGESMTRVVVGALRQEFPDFGKGRHKAGLNFGDCFAYALAKATGEPLLFKGNDFSQTDIKAAIER